MLLPSFPRTVARIAVLGAVLALTGPAAAQTRPDARSQSAKKPKPAKPPPGKKGRAPEAAPPSDAPADEAAPEGEAATQAPKTGGAGETGVKAAGAEAAATTKAVKGVKEEESASGVKTYQFGAVEVEGRLRSPQILYFLRRVRAEFDAAALGHRSFLRELADTRNDPAFR